MQPTRCLVLALIGVSLLASCHGWFGKKKKNTTVAANANPVATKVVGGQKNETKGPGFLTSLASNLFGGSQTQAGQGSQGSQQTGGTGSTGRKKCPKGKVCRKRRRNRRRRRRMNTTQVQEETKKGNRWLDLFRKKKNETKESLKKSGHSFTSAIANFAKEKVAGVFEEVFDDAKEAAKIAWANMKADVKEKTKVTVMRFIQSTVADVSSKLCDCGPNGCSCCASVGPFGNGCLNITIDTPYKSENFDEEDYEYEVEDPRIFVEVFDNKRDRLLASLIMEEGKNQQIPACFDLLGFNDICIRQSSFTYQDGTLFSCFKMQLEAFRMTAKHCISKSEDGDAVLAGAPFKLLGAFTG